ncbi:MAG: rod shape-determining protein MreD [bacterium]
MRAFVRINLLWILIAFVGDTMVGPMVSFKGVRPDFSIIALVVLGLAAGSLPATVGGFVLGLVQDLANPALLGLQALCKTWLGFGLGRLRGRLVYGMPLVEGVVILLAVLAHDLVFLLVQSRLGDEAFLVPFVTQALPTALYSGLVGVPVVRLAALAGILKPED